MCIRTEGLPAQEERTRNDKCQAKPLDAPGGKLEAGECAKEALKRELLGGTSLALDTAVKAGVVHIRDCKCAAAVP